MAFHNRRLYEHLRGAVERASDLLQAIRDGHQELRSGTKFQGILSREAPVIACVGYLMEDNTIPRLREISGAVERSEEARSTVFRHVKGYLGYPDSLDDEFMITNDNDGVPLVITRSELVGKFREFNEKSFTDYYRDYEGFLYSDQPLKYLIVASLENLISGSLGQQVTRFSEDTRIAPGKALLPRGPRHSIAERGVSLPWEEVGAAEVDLDRYWDEYESDRPGPPPAEFVLVIHHKLERSRIPSECRSYIQSIADERVEQFLDVLRLHKKESTCDVDWGWIAWIPPNPCDPPYNAELPLRFQGRRCPAQQYSLEDEEVEGLRQLLERFRTASGKEGFPHVALKCYRDGPRARNPGDRLRAFITGLESLFPSRASPIGPAAQGSRSPIAPDLARMTACFLEEDGGERRGTERRVREAYQLRTTIVHQKKVVDDRVYEEPAARMEGLLRRAILRWLDKLNEGQNADSILLEVSGMCLKFKYRG